MSDRHIIAVLGATGAQGGGVVRAIAAHPDGGFSARAITRDPSSDAAKALAALPNVEVVQADADDQASLERAFSGCHGAFCVTFFWVDFSPEHEMAQARNMAAAAKVAGVRHVIWSTLEDTRRFVTDDRMPTLQGKYKVPHFDGKEDADAAFREAGVPTTFLRTSFYWENFIYFGSGPVRGEDGVLALTFPMGAARLPGIAAEDIGKTAYGIFARGDELIGKTISIAGEHLTVAEIAGKMGRAIGEEVRYNAVEADVFRSFGFPGADEVGNMFQFKRDFEAEYVGPRDLDYARTLNPELQDFDTWLAANAEKIPLG
ncbi:MAG: NmrA/HSCARG family protein [Actinobacteria bacterium]|nr:MAG: NmrA/HSCARG family protein [Actinomycetota bacterium]